MTKIEALNIVQNESGYIVGEAMESYMVRILIEKIYSQFDKIKCSNCNHFSYEECQIIRIADTLSGLNEFVRIEIDDPNYYYCADFELKDKD